MKFNVHTLKTAPEGSRSTLADIEKAFRFIPNLHGTLANSPLALSAYVQLSRLIQSQSSLSPPDQQVVMLSASFENGCDYCMAAHSTVAAMTGVPSDTLQALREGKLPADPKTAALVAFTRALVRQRGWVSEESQAEFIAAGYTREQILEVVVVIALKTISNYTNHLAGTPLDDAFAGQKWTRPG